ncbi:MAG: D-alanyl-D-alanine carboxypeptidase/D-alanyl-D-alanine-endopeptidase [Cardiobacteriaceae bacterium]|nr:D-alanyl-D-alanine carboxypeptidase/D-alanyl-D-alanine-endopeptidase [Cardiobacteriaceae bacterium]
MRIIRLMLVMALMLQSALSWGQHNVPVAVSEMLSKDHVNVGDVSVWVQALDAEQPLVALNVDTVRHPASVAKLFTTAAGLIHFGAEHRFGTRFFVDELPDANGVLQGNLYIAGGGDPYLVQERLRNTLSALMHKGVRHIKGDIVLDDGLFVLSAEERDAGSFDGAPWSPYNAVPHPLMVDFRTINLTATPSKSGLNLSIKPHMASWTLKNNIQLQKGKCKGLAVTARLERSEQGFVNLVLSGTMQASCGSQTVALVAGEAVEQFYYHFREQWLSLGGTFQGSGRVGRVPSTAKLLHVGESVPVAEQIAMMNQMSNNVMTRQLMLNLGASYFRQTGTLALGREAVRQVLSGHGVAISGLYLDNGAGLSRQTQTSAREVASLLRVMYFSPHAEAFLSSLAVAGRSGTLKKRFVGEPLAGEVWGKTGTVREVRAFAGYVYARSGRAYLVVVLGQGKTAVNSRTFQDRLMRWVFEQ